MKSNRELITIIIPVYQVETYLRRCIASVLEQTYPNLEIILVDDGSVDRSPFICDEYAASDSRVRVIHKQNGGLSSARNAALEEASGEYIGFVDSDDYIHPEMFRYLYESMKKHQADITVCGHFTERGSQLLLEDPPIDQETVYTSKDALYELVNDTDMKSYAWDKLYKATLFQGVRYPLGRNYEDIATTYLLFDKAAKIVQIPEYLYYYQIRDDSISANVSQKKWHKNCHDSIVSQQERISYFHQKKYTGLEQLALGKLLPYLFSYIESCYAVNDRQNLEHIKKYLSDHKSTLLHNNYIQEKDKKLIPVYTSFDVMFGCYRKSKSYLRQIAGIAAKLKRCLPYPLNSGKTLDFTLDNEKNKRLVLFESPCFDNLGDHAIAYAQCQFLKQIVSQNPSLQLFIVQGWDTLDAIASLRTVAAKDDIIICHGGGNIGNLYLFAEEFRRKIFKNFYENPIIVFPQTVYFTNDAIGKKELEASRKIYNHCKRLTLLARDHTTYEKMKVFFQQATVVEMLDIVASLDETVFSAKDRHGILLCLRSDKESALTASDKKLLQKLCAQTKEDVKITDTVTGKEISNEEREAALFSKWHLFGSSRLVVTDRLHGMIFSMITKTPCIVLGNNHHKVLKTYKTLKKCSYLYYAKTTAEVEHLIPAVLKKELPAELTDFNEQFKRLEQLIVCNK